MSDDIRRKIEASSLGTPEAAALRATISDDHAARVVARSEALSDLNLAELRQIAEAADADWGSPTPTKALRQFHEATYPPTVLALLDRLDRLEAAERAVAYCTHPRAQLKQVLAMISDRLDEFSYDELSSLIEDEPLDEWGERYVSRLEAAEAKVQRVREVLESSPPGPLVIPAESLHDRIVRALDGGETGERT